jgi:hypothetical protein
MATKPLRRHIRHKPRPGDRVFTRRLVPRPVLPVPGPESPPGHAPRPPLLRSNQYLRFSLNGRPPTWPCLSGANDDDDELCTYAFHLPILTPPPGVGHLFRPPPAQKEEKARRCGATASLERGVRSYCFPLHRGTARASGKVEHDSQERADLVCLVFVYIIDRTSHISFRFQNKRQSMRNTNRQSASVRGVGSDNPPGAHHGGSSRTASIQSTVSTVPMPPHRPSSVSANPQQATYIPPSPTDAAYFSLSRTSQPQQGASGQYRSPSRNRENYDDYYDGGGPRRSRV